jgi:hypothetical protein
MANRREFLQGSAAVAALPLVSGAGLAPLTARSQPGLHKVLADERFKVTRGFAERIGERGGPLERTEGDVTSLWFNDLHHVWSKGPQSIAGLTGPDVLFCLERLAWDYRMSVGFLAEHEMHDSTPATHKIISRGAKLRDRDLIAAGPRWTDVIADELLRFQPSQGAAFGPTSVGLAKSEHDRNARLVSWVIAPRARSQA